ncbi:hypothetical protein KFK09_020533 [Dendrobium nobile]|uniref:Uncharacterized protein n=1 Tax=Dendrobium nobile TaxID=94219 RepID=A0A8T3AMH5_DENNO|nr:hypothetical protein KFK09_020533 [Dendrobium nobile]
MDHRLHDMADLRPPALSSKNTFEQRENFERWIYSNRMSLIIMNHSIPYTIRGALPEEENAKKFLRQLVDQFPSSEKS